jgi:hypothetical protein
VSISKSNLEIAAKKATTYAADKENTLLVIRNAPTIIRAEKKDTTTACAMYSGNPVNRIMLDVNMW